MEAAARSLINQKIEKFGVINRLQIDSKNKRLAAEVALKGEATPILLEVDGYEIKEQGGENYLVLQKVRASREWLEALLQEVVVNRPWKIPSMAKMVL